MFDSLQPHELQHARLPCPSLSPQVCSDSCPLSRECHPIISSSATLFSFWLLSSQHQGPFQWVGPSYPLAKLLEFWLQHQSSNEYSGLISFWIDWFHLLAVQGTLKSFLQYHNSKLPVLRHSAFFIIHLSHPNITIWIFVGKNTYPHTYSFSNSFPI